jgi:hypothetical protein
MGLRAGATMRQRIIGDSATEDLARAAAERAQPVPARRTPAFTPMGAVLGVAVIGIALFVVIQALVWTFPPVGEGSVSAILGDAVPCAEIDADEPPPDCYRAEFAEGRDVGVGFTFRNNAPIGMTIVDIAVIRDGVLTPAVLEPQLIGDDHLFGIGLGQPSAPVDVPAGEERGIQFVGTFGDCDVVANDYVPDSGLSVSTAFMTVRWAIFQTDVEVPLTSALNLMAPDSCP